MRALNEWIEEAEYHTFENARIASWKTKSPDNAKPWLLLIHGFPTSSWDWSAIWSDLEAHFNLIALDMLGFGLSDKPQDKTYTIIEQADLQETLLKKNEITEAHILAHDYGDTVAQELLARHQDGALSFPILSLCLLNGGLFPEQHRARAIQKLGLTPLGPLLGMLMSRSTLRKTFDQIFGPDTKASDEEIDGHWSLLNHNEGLKVFHKLLQYIPQRRQHRERWVGALQKAILPMRLINGGADPISGAHLYHYYKSMIENADAVLFEDIGHYPQTEAPERVLNAFLEFHKKHGTLQS